MIILHFDLQPQFKYMSYFIYTSHHFTPHGRYELNKLASLPMCGFIAQLVERRTGIAVVTGSNPVEALIFFQASSFQLPKLEKLLRWSFFTLINNRSSNIWIISYILCITPYVADVHAWANEELAVPKFRRELRRVLNFNQSINWHQHIKDHVEIGPSLSVYCSIFLLEN